MKIKSLQIEHVGQIVCADVTFGDLSVLVGPQATGKSIFLDLTRRCAPSCGPVEREGQIGQLEPQARLP